MLPGIDCRNPHGGEVYDIARHHCQPVHDGGGSDEGIAFGARIGYVQMCTAHRHGVIHGQDSIVEGGDDVAAHPGAQKLSL